MLLSILSLASFFKAIFEDERRYYLINGLILFLAMFVHLGAFLILFCQTGFFVLILIMNTLSRVRDKRFCLKRGVWFYWMISVLMAGAGFTLSILVSRFTRNVEMIASPMPLVLTTYLDMFRIFCGGDLWIAIFSIVVVVLSLTISFKERREKALFFILWLVLPYFSLVYLLTLKKSFYAVRFLIFVLPVFIIALADGLSLFVLYVEKSKTRFWKGIGLLLGIFFIVLFSYPNVRTILWYYEKDTKLSTCPDWRGLAEYFHKHNSNDKVVVVDPSLVLPDAGIYGLSFYVGPYIYPDQKIFIPSSALVFYDIYPPNLAFPVKKFLLLEEMDGIVVNTSVLWILPLPQLDLFVRNNMEEWWGEQHDPMKNPTLLGKHLDRFKVTIFDGCALVESVVNSINEFNLQLKEIKSVIEDKVYKGFGLRGKYLYKK